ncbi:MAG: hypothetical protein AAF310_06185, partial [Myxococcota bacterium]
REIKTHLQGNATLRHLFGDLVDPSCWRQGELSVAGRTRTSKEATITARGCSGAVVGLHFDVHLIDDLVNEDNARTKGQRDKLEDWVHMSLDPTLQPQGCRILTGTRYHPNDFYNHTLSVFAGLGRDEGQGTSGAGRRVSEKGRGEQKPGHQEKQDTLGKGKVDLQQGKDEQKAALPSSSFLKLQALQPDGRSLWPQKFSVEWLQRKRQRMGSIRFNAQYQNDCALMQGKVFRQGDIRYYDRADLDVSQLTIVQGVDVAIGQGQQHDYFALVTKGYDAQGRGYTLDVVRGHYSFQQQMMLLLYKSGYSARSIGQVLGMRCAQRDIDALFAGQPAAARTQYGEPESVLNSSSNSGQQHDAYVIRSGCKSESQQKTTVSTLWQWAQRRWGQNRNKPVEPSPVCSRPPRFMSLGGMNNKHTVCVKSKAPMGPCVRVGVEGVAYQRVLGEYLLQRAPALPLVCLQQRLDKRSRMSIYAARFESHQEFFPADNSCDALLEEVLLFPDGQHDDVLDAHEMAHRVALPLLQQPQDADNTQVRVFV